MLLKFFWWCVCIFLWISCIVHMTRKSLIYAKFSLKLNLTALFTHLKIILLQYSVFSNKRYPNKPLFFLLVHIYSYTSFNFFTFPLPLYLQTILNFTITLPSFFSLFYILTILLPFLFCINFISFFPFNPYFSHKKIVSTLSLSL